VALTLPSEVVRGLRRLDGDLAWAIVRLFERDDPDGRSAPAPPDVELVTVAPDLALIVVNPRLVKTLPGVQVIPIGEGRGFLALQNGHGLADLELAIVDRLERRSVGRSEAAALKTLRNALRRWRRRRALQFHTRAIILAERRNGGANGGRP